MDQFTHKIARWQQHATQQALQKQQQQQQPQHGDVPSFKIDPANAQKVARTIATAAAVATARATVAAKAHASTHHVMTPRKTHGGVIAPVAIRPSRLPSPPPDGVNNTSSHTQHTQHTCTQRCTSDMGGAN